MSVSHFQLEKQLRRFRSRVRNSEAYNSSVARPYNEPQPVPVGFLDPALQYVRNLAVFRWFITTIGLMAFVFGVLSIYWGALYHVSDKVSHMGIVIVDFDGLPPYDYDIPLIVGPTIVDMGAKELDSAGGHLGWDLRSPADFNNDANQVDRAVYNQDYWAAIIINHNATALLRSAIATGNGSYDPFGACQLVYVASRDEMNCRAKMDRHHHPERSDPSILANMQNASQALNPSIGFSEYNLRPFWPYSALPAVVIGLIYLIITSFFSIAFYLPIHMAFVMPANQYPLKFWQWILGRWCSIILAYLFLSLSYSLVSVAFQVKFIQNHIRVTDTEVASTSDGNHVAYGSGTFPVYWMLNFWGINAVGLACENVAMIVGPPWMGLWLIFWVITNVCSGLYDLEILPGFYRWGYAWPLHQVVEGSSHVLFDLHSRIGFSFGTLIAWGAVNTALFPLCCWFSRWKTKKGVVEYWSNQ